MGVACSKRTTQAAHTMLLLVALQMVFACDRDRTTTEDTVARDSAGILIVENGGPTVEGKDGWALSGRPTLQIGEGPGADQQFEWIVAAFHFGLGRIVVVDRRAPRLRVYDGSGALIAAAGREGSGPGEFRLLEFACRYRSDSIGTYDPGRGLFSVFDSNLDYIRAERMQADSLPTVTNPVACLADGSLLVRGPVPGEIRLDMPDGRKRIDERIFRFDVATGHADLVYQGPGSEVYSVQTARRVPAGWVPWFARSLVVGSYGNGYYLGLSDTYELQIHDGTGQLKRMVRRHGVERPVRESDVHRLQSEMLEGFDRTPYGSRVRQAILDPTAPSTMPAFGRPGASSRPVVLVDSREYLWVLEYHFPQDRDQLWDVFDREGVFLGSVSMPSAFAPLEVDERWVLGVWTDTNDVQSLREYQIRTSPPRGGSS
jgi:hypothetical protein